MREKLPPTTKKKLPPPGSCGDCVFSLAVFVGLRSQERRRGRGERRRGEEEREESLHTRASLTGPSPNVSPPTMADRTGYTATTITSSTTTTREEDGSRDMVDVAEEATWGSRRRRPTLPPPPPPPPPSPPPPAVRGGNPARKLKISARGGGIHICLRGIRTSWRGKSSTSPSSFSPPTVPPRAVGEESETFPEEDADAN